MKTPRIVNRLTAFTGALAVAVSIAAGGAVHAKVKYYTLLEKARSAPIILTGSVTELRGGSVIVRVGRTIKGTADPQIELLWDRNGSVELPAAVHAVGDDVLVFAERKGDVYAPFAGPQGTLTLQPLWGDQYEAAIRQILQFDAAATADEKTRVLTDMLQQDRLAQAAALESVYFEFAEGAFATGPLVPPLIRLAQRRDSDLAPFAIRVLGRIGGESAILPMIELMASPNATVAETAFAVVKAVTRADLDFNPRANQEARAAAAKRWADWWAANRSTVVLIR